MDHAREVHSGLLVSANEASRLRPYVCPRPGCGGRVYLPNVIVQRPHFRHFPGEGTSACEEYFPSGGDRARVIEGVEEDPTELGLVLNQVDGRWGLGLRLPEIPSEELGETSLSALRPALVNVYSGSDRVVRVGALVLRPGVEAARIDVEPSLGEFRTEPAGTWPPSVDKERWRLQSRGLDATGTLFRLRRGEWMRLLPGSVVHQRETLVVLADTHWAPPNSIVLEAHAPIFSGGLQWTVWEVQLPTEPVANVLAWLARLGHAIVPRPWSLDLAMPPRAYGEQGEPVYWVGDTPVLTLEAPQYAASAAVALQNGTNSQTVNFVAQQNRSTYVTVSVCDEKLVRLFVVGERSASLDFTFILRPADFSLEEVLAHTARLRIQIGQLKLAAWQGHNNYIQILKSAQPELRVDLGDETARARVTVWERGKQRSRCGLDSRGVVKALQDALVGSEKIEVDAGNLGRVVLLLVRGLVSANRTTKVSERLAWRDYVVNMSPPSAEPLTPILVEQPRLAKSLIARHSGAAGLIRARMALRRRLTVRGNRT